MFYVSISFSHSTLSLPLTFLGFYLHNGSMFLFFVFPICAPSSVPPVSHLLSHCMISSLFFSLSLYYPHYTHPHNTHFYYTCSHETAQKEKNKMVIKLVSGAGTGFFYIFKKTPQLLQKKMAVRKFDPIVNQHVIFNEAKLKFSTTTAQPLQHHHITANLDQHFAKRIALSQYHGKQLFHSAQSFLMSTAFQRAVVPLAGSAVTYFLYQRYYNPPQQFTNVSNFQ